MRELPPRRPSSDEGTNEPERSFTGKASQGKWCVAGQREGTTETSEPKALAGTLFDSIHQPSDTLRTFRVRWPVSR